MPDIAISTANTEIRVRVDEEGHRWLRCNCEAWLSQVLNENPVPVWQRFCDHTIKMLKQDADLRAFFTGQVDRLPKRLGGISPNIPLNAEQRTWIESSPRTPKNLSGFVEYRDTILSNEDGAIVKLWANANGERWLSCDCNEFYRGQTTSPFWIRRCVHTEKAKGQRVNADGRQVIVFDFLAGTINNIGNLTSPWPVNDSVRSWHTSPKPKTLPLPSSKNTSEPDKPCPPPDRFDLVNP